LLTDGTRREKLASAAKSAVNAYSWKTRMTGIMRVMNNTLNH